MEINNAMQETTQKQVTMDAEVAALATAYQAIKSQPREAHDRMLAWLTQRLESDARTVAQAARSGR